MITGTNQSKQPTDYIDVPKYIGVGTIKILAINPNNAKLRTFGWSIPEDAKEPEYVTSSTLEDGTIRQNTRIRFMVQLQEPEDKPVIPMDFWIRPDASFSNDHSKCKVIDNFGRTAWATKDEMKAHAIPQYSTGPASIAAPYTPCYVGQDKIVQFLRAFLVCTPYETKEFGSNTWTKSPSPGILTIDNWRALCNGQVDEIRSYVADKPDNMLKVIFGVQKTPDNKTYQTFLCETTRNGAGSYLANNARLSDGAYSYATSLINKVKDDGYHDNVEFSAAPVTKYVVTPTNVEPVQGKDVNTDILFGTSGSTEDIDDLPFELQ